jgi:multidrug efflux system outer membrane protein
MHGLKSTDMATQSNSLLSSLFLVLALLQGCLVQEPKWEAQVTQLPGAWQSGGDGNAGEVRTGWLKTFSDPELEIMVGEAIANNPALQSLAARLEASQEGTLLSSATRIPSVSATGSGSRSSVKTRDGTEGWEPWDPNSSARLGLTASWELDVWGRIGNLHKASLADHAALAADYEAARLSLAANTARAWCNLIAANQQLELTVQTRDSFVRNYRITERKYKAGDPSATSLSVNFGRNQIASAERQLLDRQLSRDESRRTLELILGRYPSASLAERGDLPSLAGNVPAGLPSDLLLRRPDLRASAQSLLASAHRAKAAEKELIPSIQLSASGSQSAPSTALKQLIENPASIATNLAVSISQPVFGRAALRASARQALSRNDAALANFRGDALQALREVESALAKEKSLSEQEPFLEQELRQAILAENQATRDYSQGIIEILSVLEAQRRAFNARSQMISFQNERLQNRIALHLALGGDFRTPETPNQ